MFIERQDQSLIVNWAPQMDNKSSSISIPIYWIFDRVEEEGREMNLADAGKRRTARKQCRLTNRCIPALQSQQSAQTPCLDLSEQVTLQKWLWALGIMPFADKNAI